MKRAFSIIFALALVLGVSLLALPVLANGDPPNTVASSTMIFRGNLTAIGGGAYIGYIPMVDESATGLGDGIAGFDVYAKQGACAYVEGYYGTGPQNCGGPDTALIDSTHDAYTSGGPWSTWFDPDCADWYSYSLELTADHWYLRYTATNESPMSGVMKWYGDGTGFAYETDLGTQNGDHGGSAAHGGGAQAWDWDGGWGVEVVPLQCRGFHVKVTVGGSPDDVELDPSDPVVGWETYPISKVRVLLPWIALAAAIIAGGSLLVLRRRRAHT